MKLGVNWTSPHNSEIVKALAETETLDFCELLIDNFLLYDNGLIKDSLPLSACSFHIMNSNFVFTDMERLKDIGKRIRKAVKVLKPLYVSDHIGLFQYHQKYLPFMQEISYQQMFRHFQERVNIWSDLLDTNIYLENFPSLQPQAPVRQVDFYQRIQNELCQKANILFDISNALVAHKNGCESVDEWKDIMVNTQHFHVAGFQKAGSTDYFLDSHNECVGTETLHLMETIIPYLHADSTLVIERDFNLVFSDWYLDIQNIKALLKHAGKN